MITIAWVNSSKLTREISIKVATFCQQRNESDGRSAPELLRVSLSNPSVVIEILEPCREFDVILELPILRTNEAYAKKLTH